MTHTSHLTPADTIMAIELLISAWRTSLSGAAFVRALSAMEYRAKMVKALHKRRHIR